MIKSIFIPLLFLALIEGTFRLVENHQQKSEHNFTKGKVIDDIAKVMRPTVHPSQGFTLLPHLRATFLDKEFSSNSLGYRDREFIKKKAKDIFRIIGIGDSVMMGWGVSDSETFLRQLEEELPRCQGKKVETLNFAIAGQSAIQEAYVLEKALNYNPDFVLINYVGNDWINEAQPRKKPQFMGPSHALNFLINAPQGLPWHSFQKSTLPPIDSLPRAYQEMAGLLKDKKSLIFMDSRYESEITSHQKAAQLFSRLGLQSINSLEEWNPEAKSLTGQQAVTRETEFNRLYLIPNDWHPNALWHKRVAKRLARSLRKSYCR